MARQFIRIRALQKKMGGCSASTVWRRVADGTLPPGRKIGGMSVWDEDEVDEHLGLAKRDTEDA